jgi:hypothetical protein
MNNNMNRKTQLDSTIASIREHVRQLEARLKETEQQLQEKRALLNAWVAEYEGLESDDERKDKSRLPRGEALKRVNQIFVNSDAARLQGLTVKAIADATGLKWTTARNVVNEGKNGFVQLTEGVWIRAKDRPPPSIPDGDDPRRRRLTVTRPVANVG